MRYSKFEEMPVWQEARVFTSLVYSIVEKNASLKKDYGLADQLRRATVSILLNISEGFERGSNKDYAHFMDFAKGSAGEVRSISYVLLDNKFINKTDFEKLHTGAENLSIQLSRFKKYLVSNEFKKGF